MGVDIKMSLSLFLTLFLSSVLTLVVFHITFLVLWYMGLVARLAGKRPEILTILQNSAVLSIACCVFYTHCGNKFPTRDKSLRRKNPGYVESLVIRDNSNRYSGWPQMHEWKEQVCSTWLAPVGYASDYPVFSKWVIYGELADNISPVYSLWATFIGLYIANYVVERSTGWALTHPHSASLSDIRKISMNPDFLDMVPWYSGTSADLFKTAFDLLVSVTLFLGRFDMRMMQAAMTRAQDSATKEGFLYDHLSTKTELWFDFMADTGDGGNSTYTVARLLAKPSLRVSNKDFFEDLPRGKLLLIGGDLAYPNPSPFTYERRLFCPFEFALQPPPCYKPENIAVSKPELPAGVDLLTHYEGPQVFAIPGNQDWFDGLDTFMRYICHKSWLGGWLLPQQRSYFALQLPHGWWIFGFDQALHGDIDIYQFKFFSELVKKQVGINDSVIIVTHEPSWLLDWYWHDCTGKNVSHLIQDHLKGRCRIRMAGDLHHYMRHSALPSGKPVYVQHLLVNGCGGAFLHPTHTFSNFRQFLGTCYENKVAYPPYEDSKRIALGNILKFRKKNWQFDVIGGIIYFVLVFSIFPQATLRPLCTFCLARTISSYISLSGYHTLYEWYRSVESEHFPDPTGLRTRIEEWTLGLYPACIKYLMSAFDVPEVMAVTRSNICKGGMETLPRGFILIYYICIFLYFWVFSTPVVSLVFGSYLYICINWLHIHFDEAFSSLRIANYKSFTRFHITSEGCLEVYTLAVDKVIAVTRNTICKSGMETLPRGFTLIYYMCIFIYFWVFSTPVVSLVFGSYLYICINWFHIHFDEAYSSLRIANYKSFTRFHITPTGDLDVYTLAVDKVPREWELDSHWEAEQKKRLPSHLRQHPSKWAPKSTYPDPNCTVRIIDHFVVKRNLSEII